MRLSRRNNCESCVHCAMWAKLASFKRCWGLGGQGRKGGVKNELLPRNYLFLTTHMERISSAGRRRSSATEEIRGSHDHRSSFVMLVRAVLCGRCSRPSSVVPDGGAGVWLLIQNQRRRPARQGSAPEFEFAWEVASKPRRTETAGSESRVSLAISQ
jgi:hypothetical protein